MPGLPVRRRVLSSCDLVTRQLRRQCCSLLFCLLLLLPGGERQPEVCFFSILFDTPARRIAGSQPGFRWGIALICSLSVVSCSHAEILGRPTTAFRKQSEMVLRFR